MPHIITAAPLGQLAALDVHQLYKLRVDVFVHEQRCPYAEIDATCLLYTSDAADDIL